METDSHLRRQYVWQVAQKALVRASKARREKRWSESELEHSFGQFVLDNLDWFAEP